MKNYKAFKLLMYIIYIRRLNTSNIIYIIMLIFPTLVVGLTKQIARISKKIFINCIVLLIGVLFNIIIFLF